MASTPKKLAQSWSINTLAVLVAVYINKGIHCQGPLDVLVASLVLGILNAVVRPFLLWMTLPLLFLSLGLFLFVINGLLLYFVGFLLRPHFYVDGFWSAFWGALVISLVSLILNSLTGTGNARVKIERHRPPRDMGGSGPIIDV
jgi:putative membrane protein